MPVIRSIPRPVVEPFLVDWSTPEEIVEFFAQYGIETTVTEPEPDLFHAVSNRSYVVVRRGQGFNLDGAPYNAGTYQTVPADQVDFVVSEI